MDRRRKFRPVYFDIEDFLGFRNFGAITKFTDILIFLLLNKERCFSFERQRVRNFLYLLVSQFSNSFLEQN